MLKYGDNLPEPRVRSLQDTLETVLASAGLAKTRRKNLASSIRTFSRTVGRPPSTIKEDIVVVRQEMAKASPRRANITPETWKAVRGNLMASLRLCGLAVVSGRSNVPCSLATRALLDAIPVKPHRLALISAARFCAENGYELIDFDQQKSEEFRTYLSQRHPRKTHHRIYLRAVRMWNRCRTEFPEFWPRTQIDPQFKLDRYTFSESSFSPEFNADVAAMIADAIKPPLRRRNVHRAIKPSTARKRRYTVYRVASTIVHRSGVAPSTFKRLADIIDPDKVEDALDYLEGRGAQEKSGDLHAIAKTMHTIAKYWVRPGDEVLRELSSIRRAVMPAEGPSQKNIDLCRMFKDPRLEEAFLLMPERVVARLRRKAKLSRNDAVQGQLATVAGIMIDAPMRGMNVVQLHQARHIIDNGSGASRQVRIFVHGDEVKNEVALNFLLRLRTVRLLDTYRKVFLPILTDDASGFLIPGRHGEHKRQANLSLQLASLTSRELGVRMTAHQWRHVVGFIFLRHHPGEYEPVRRLLGHKSLETTMKFYAFMLDEDAQETIDATFEEIRQRGRHSYRRRNGLKGA